MMLGDMLRALFRRPATERYPAEPTATPESLRGLLHWSPDACTGCALCVKDCPAGAIKLLTIDKAAKRFVMQYDAARCTYCGQCVQSCRFGCIALSDHEWELAADDPSAFDHLYGRDADVLAYLGNAPERDDPAPAPDSAACGRRRDWARDERG